MASDLIYREDAKDYVRHAFAKGLNVLEYLDEVPAANFRPVVHGQWIRNDRGNYNCSNCKGEQKGVFGFDFCPYCGVDMREKTERIVTCNVR